MSGKDPLCYFFSVSWIKKYFKNHRFIHLICTKASQIFDILKPDKKCVVAFQLIQQLNFGL